MQIVQQQQTERLKTLEEFLSVYEPIVRPEGGFMDGDCVDSRTDKLSTNVRLKLYIPTANGRYGRTRDGGSEFLLVSSKGISMKGRKIKLADFNKTIGVLRDAGVPMSAHDVAEAQVLFLQKEKDLGSPFH
jgi:hypothetical protein